MIEVIRAFFNSPLMHAAIPVVTLVFAIIVIAYVDHEQDGNDE